MGWFQLKRSKAQFSTIDALFGITGMLAALILSLALFSLFYEGVALSIEKKDMETKAYYAMEELLSRGEPANWHTLNESAVNNYGMEYEMGVLDENKVSALMATNYSLVKDRLGISKYNFSITILNSNSEPVYSFGANSTGQNTTLTIERLSTLNNSLALVRLKVFR